LSSSRYARYEVGSVKYTATSSRCPRPKYTSIIRLTASLKNRPVIRMATENAMPSMVRPDFTGWRSM